MAARASLASASTTTRRNQRWSTTYERNGQYKAEEKHFPTNSASPQSADCVRLEAPASLPLPRSSSQTAVRHANQHQWHRGETATDHSAHNLWPLHEDFQCSGTVAVTRRLRQPFGYHGNTTPSQHHKPQEHDGHLSSTQHSWYQPPNFDTDADHGYEPQRDKPRLWTSHSTRVPVSASPALADGHARRTLQLAQSHKFLPPVMGEEARGGRLTPMKQSSSEPPDLPGSVMQLGGTHLAISARGRTREMLKSSSFAMPLPLIKTRKGALPFTTNTATGPRSPSSRNCPPPPAHPEPTPSRHHQITGDTHDTTVLTTTSQTVQHVEMRCSTPKLVYKIRSIFFTTRSFLIAFSVTLKIFAKVPSPKRGQRAARKH